MSQDQPCPRPTILVIDDDASLNATMCNWLLTFFPLSTIRNFYDGEQAAVYVQTIAADIALIDVGLPGIDGFKTAAKVKEACPACRVILMSGSDNSDYTNRTIDAGGDLYISKLDLIEKLIPTVKKWLADTECVEIA